jgi:Ca2+-binding RTX toxin-like protein
MSTVYVSPTGSGDKSGSSAANAKPVTALDSAIQQAGAGGTVNMLADKGSYNLSGSVIISHGGSATAPVKIQGVSSSGAAMDITVNGTRDPNWKASSTADGNTVFKLYAGADNLDFEHMHFNNVGMAFQLGGNLKNVTLGNMYADNVQYFTGNYPGGGSATADVTGLTMHDVQVHGFSKSVLILKGNASNIKLDHVYGDGEYQDGDNFEMGVALQGTVHDVVISNTTMKNTIADISTTGNYTNGDGFASEAGVKNVQFINCVSTGNGDGGFDLKSSQTTLTNCYAEDNKRNYRIWGSDVTIKDSVGVDPHKRVLSADGTQTNIWIASTAHNVQVVGGKYVDSGSATDVVHSDGGDVHFSGTTIWHASAGHLATGSNISGIDSSLVHSVSSTGSYSSNGEQYLGGGTSPIPTPTPPPPAPAPSPSPSPTPTPGDKVLNGTSSNDTLTATTSEHWTVNALAGNDKITTLGGDDTITAGGGNDVLNAGTGNDSIYGGGGKDIMTGGAGSDMFIFKHLGESTKLAGDTITDFTHGADKMDLSVIDANNKVSGNNAFTFLDQHAFTGHAGELRVDHTDSTKTVVQADVNGDKVIDFQVTLTGHVDLTTSDFIF